MLLSVLPSLLLLSFSFPPTLSLESPAKEYGWPYTTSFSSPQDFKIYVYPYRPTYEERIQHMKNPVNEKFHSPSSSSSSPSHFKHHMFLSSATLSAGYPALRNLSQPFDMSILSRPFNFRGQAFGLGVEYRIASAIINSEYVTQNPDEADLFFVHYAPHRGDHTQDARKVAKMLEDSPYYHSDIPNHFFIHNLPWYSLWSSSSSSSPPPPSLIDVSPEQFKPKFFHHIPVPYSDDGWGTDLRTWGWDDIQKKKYLACFVGSLSRVRGAQEDRRVLREQFRKSGGGEGKEVLWKEFGKKAVVYNYSEQMTVIRQCRYCPIPKGDSASSKRFFDAIQADCIPVVLADDFLFPFEDLINYEDFIYSIPERQLSTKAKTDFNFIDFVSGISEREEKEKRNRLREAKHHFIFNDPFIYPGDAMDLVMRELFLRAGVVRGRKRAIQQRVQKKRKQLGLPQSQQPQPRSPQSQQQDGGRSILESLRSIGRGKI